MINGDHVQPEQNCSEPQCAACRDRGWIDDMSTAVRYLRRCPACDHEREPVSASR
jgi:predicted Zn-ribbon and HTH transcriptional regulator